MIRHLIPKLFSRRPSQAERTAAPTVLDPLEPRRLMSSLMTIKAATFDNRGEAILNLSAAAMASTVTKDNIRVYTAGPDKKLGTADDARVSATVTYSSSKKQIVIEANLAHDTPYKIRVYGNRVKDINGHFIDGEFKGTFRTGNGTAGGDFNCLVNPDTSATPLVRMDTNFGVITLKMFKGLKPKSVANFLAYANKGQYDNMVVTRSAADFVIQMGSLQINKSNTLVEPTPMTAIKNEYTTNGIIQPTLGTVAWAKGNGPDTAQNQFFFNEKDNSAILDPQNGGFTVFAACNDSSSLAIMENIAALQTVALFDDLSDPNDTTGVAGPFNATGISDVPVKDRAVYNGNGTDELISDGQGGVRAQFVVTGNFNPTTQLVVIRRTAELMKVSKG